MAESFPYSSEVESLRNRLKNDEQLSRAFPAERHSIYQVPLPEGGAGLRYDNRKETWRVAPGERLYVIDSDPLGMFKKPTAVAAFGSNSGEPLFFAVGHWNLFVNELAFPFFDPAVLRQWAVHHPEPLILADEEGKIIIKGKKDKEKETKKAEDVLTGPIHGPFPPKDPPEPAPNDPDPYPPDPPLTKPDPTACVPRLLFYGICCEHDILTLMGQGFIWNETQEVTKAFKARGYDTSEGLAGRYAPDGSTPAKTLDQMMNGLEKAIARDADAKANKFCQCPEDQLVIWIAAHGVKGYFQWKPYNVDEELLPYTQLFERLAQIPEIKKNPKKVYLLFLGCQSGTLWDDGVIPPGLEGMHLISSAPDSKTNSYGGTFTKWVVEAVQKAKNWAHFVAILKHLHRQAKTNKSRPRAGDVVGCFATLKLVDITFKGDDIGFMDGYMMRVDGKEIQGQGHLFHGHSLQPGLKIFEGFFGPCGKGKSVEVTAAPYVRTSATGAFQNQFTATITFDCDNQTHQGKVVADLTVVKDKITYAATITFTVEIKTTC